MLLQAACSNVARNSAMVQIEIIKERMEMGTYTNLIGGFS
jgi:hypothetical protein